MKEHKIFPFNNRVEAGLRMLIVLTSGFPLSFDLERLVFYDYMVVHSGDIDKNVQSIHPAVPNRTGEIFIRRTVLQDGMDLFCNKGLIKKVYSSEGISYSATESAMPFLESLTEEYTEGLINRSDWLINRYGETKIEDLREIFSAAMPIAKNEFNLDIL